jgi:hypothetical protein
MSCVGGSIGIRREDKPGGIDYKLGGIGSGEATALEIIAGSVAERTKTDL